MESIEARRLDGVLEELRKRPITLEEILTVDPIPALFNPFDLKILLPKASYMTKRWLAKRGLQLGRILTLETKVKVSYGMIKKALLEIIYRRIMGFYGITGVDQLKYFNLGNKVARAYERYEGPQLLKWLDRTVKRMIEDGRLDKDIAKVVVLATLKACTYARNKYYGTYFDLEPEARPEEAPSNGS